MEVKIPENFDYTEEFRNLLRAVLQSSVYKYTVGNSKCVLDKGIIITCPLEYVPFFTKFMEGCRNIINTGIYREDTWAAIAVPCYIKGYIPKDILVTSDNVFSLTYEEAAMQEYIRDEEKRLVRDMFISSDNNSDTEINIESILKMSIDAGGVTEGRSIDSGTINSLRSIKT